MKRVRYIAFVGIDGCGKTTQAKLLVESLTRKGLKVSHVWSRWEPFLLRFFIKSWKNSLTKNIEKSEDKVKKLKSAKQRFFKNSFFQLLWLFFFLIEYTIQIFSKITVKLFLNRIIISDRTFYDSMIDQSINLGDKNNLLFRSLDWPVMQLAFPRPDLVLYIDCPENVAFLRKNDITDVSALEERRFLYKQLANKYGWEVLNGALSVNEVFINIKDVVNKKIGL